jgi:hypothetical protein
MRLLGKALKREGRRMNFLLPSFKSNSPDSTFCKKPFGIYAERIFV